MNIRELTETEIRTYPEAVPGEFIDDIKREYWRGLAGIEDDPDEMKAGVIWELKNAGDEEKPNEAEIMWFYAKNAEDGRELLESLDEVLKDNEVESVYFELTSLSREEEKALSVSGYLLESGESRDIIVTAEDIAALKMLKKAPDDYVYPLSKITNRQFKAGIMTCVFHDRYGILEDLPFVPMTRFDPGISCCVQTDDKVDGFLLVHSLRDDLLRVELFCAIQPDANIHLLNMMCFAARAVTAPGHPAVNVILRRHNKASIDLIRKLFPGKKGETVRIGERNLR